MNKFGIIYKITNLINNKCYIGQTIKKGGFDARYYNNLFKHCHNMHLKRAIEKYGIENFLIEKEFDVAYSREELNEKEQYYINKYNSNHFKFGYNIKSGGDNKGQIKGLYKAQRLLKQAKPVFCKTTCEIFLSLVDIEKKYGVSKSVVRSQCIGRGYREKSIFSETLNKYLYFEYYYHMKRSVSGYNQTPIYCITTGERFISISNIAKKFNLNYSILCRRLNESTYLDKPVRMKNKDGEIIEIMYLYFYEIQNYTG